ncbi:peptide ABC transporter substrate-binding protein [Gynuella sp.]|uniref:peptide ABC transporter substrate-binding protein n=1 Tax=Gynuella sp. TaxID=2969146 RepID=UPI003D13BC5D
MKVITKTIAAGIISVAMLSPMAYAKKHPITGEELAADQTFTYRMLDEIDSLDPQLIEGVDASNVARDLFEGLVNQDADGNLMPGVAQRWVASPDNMSFRFYLRQNAKWSNGDPVTAHDFVYAWRRLADPATASPYSWFMEIMNVENASAIVSGEKEPSTLGVKAVDDYTLDVKLSQPMPYFPKMVAHTSTFPVNQKVIEKYGSDWTKPGNMVGNGAYVLTEYVVNERSVRERNKYYWNNDATIIDKVVAMVINDENQAYARFKAGEVMKTDIPAGQFQRLLKENPEETKSMPQLCTYYYNFNMTRPPFDDVRVRKALSYAIDRDVIAKRILGAGQTSAYVFTPPKTNGFVTPDLAWEHMTQKERDQKARELLAEAGFTKANPLKLAILYNTSEDHKRIAIAISQMWKQKLGVDATLENLEWKTYLETKKLPDYDVSRAGWCGDYNEASTFLTLMMSDNAQNDSKYKNPQYDTLMKESTGMADPNVNYTQAEQLLARDMPIAPIYHYAEDIAISKYLKGWPYNNIEQNIYSKDMYIIAH